MPKSTAKNIPTAPEERFMRAALRLARRAQGATSPNPAVGAVVVKNGEIIGRGYTRPPGGPHAEVVALDNAGPAARGADLYVTLEPCCHHGRTPPCTDKIIAAGPARLFAAMPDPNPRVNGRGLALLRQAGLTVEVGLLARQARALNEGYIKYITSGLPLLTLKLACSLDGKIATPSGDSRWITGEKARRFAHSLRARHDALLVGAGTVLADDPELTVRLTKGRHPRRVIVDSRARIPASARVLLPADPPPVVAVTAAAPAKRRQALATAGAQIWTLPAQNGRVNLRALLKKLAENGITSVLCEGGGELAASLLEARLADYAWFIFAPLIVGGEAAPTAVRGRGCANIADSLRLARVTTRRFGEDLAIGGYLPGSPLLDE